MDPKTSNTALIIASIAYGIAVAILGALDSPAMQPVAIFGALLVGGLWAVRGMLTRGRDDRQ